MSSPISDEQRSQLLRTETRSLLQSPDFIRSPVMSQLLTYLVEEAIANPSQPPKAYQVAVDGLGRSEDFDVQADSYPRVQVGRLRKMLAAHYAAHGGARQLHIPIGHYAVEIEMNGDEPVDELIGIASADPDDDSVPMTRGKGPMTLDSRQTTLGLAAFFLIIGVGMIWLLDLATATPAKVEENAESLRLPPKIYITSSRQGPAEANGGDVSGIMDFFADAFARSGQVRLAAAVGSDISYQPGQNAYLFESQLTNGGTDPEINFSLTSLATGETIWSTQMPLPQSAVDYPEELGPIASRVGGTYGVIAAD